MRTARLLAPIFLMAFTSAAIGQFANQARTASNDPQHLTLLPVIPPSDLLQFDLLQRTCALYVAVRSNAWKGPIAFGREIDDSLVHWNVCPGGTMVACKVTPTADGDTIVTGIPWAYGTGKAH